MDNLKEKDLNFLSPNISDNIQQDEDLNGFFVGEVVDNKDPDNLGRVKVRIFNIHDLNEKDVLPWALYCGNGKEKVVPEIGDYVLVVFVNKDINSVVYLGVLSSKKSDISSAESDQSKSDVVFENRKHNSYITHNENNFKIIKKENTSHIEVAASNPSDNVKLGTPNSLLYDKVVVENKLKTYIQTLITLINTNFTLLNIHMHPGQVAATLLGPAPVTPTPPIPIAPNVLTIFTDVSSPNVVASVGGSVPEPSYVPPANIGSTNIPDLKKNIPTLVIDVSRPQEKGNSAVSVDCYYPTGTLESKPILYLVDGHTPPADHGTQSSIKGAALGVFTIFETMAIKEVNDKVMSIYNKNISKYGSKFQIRRYVKVSDASEILKYENDVKIELIDQPKSLSTKIKDINESLLTDGHPHTLIQKDPYSRKDINVNTFYDVVVETHFNGAGSSAANGWEVLIGKNIQLGLSFKQKYEELNLNKIFKFRSMWTTPKLYKPEIHKEYNINCLERNLYMMHGPKCPSVIIEPCFLTSPMDLSTLYDPIKKEFKQDIIELIALNILEAIFDYYKSLEIKN